MFLWLEGSQKPGTEAFTLDLSEKTSSILHISGQGSSCRMVCLQERDCFFIIRGGNAEGCDSSIWWEEAKGSPLSQGKGVSSWSRRTHRRTSLWPKTQSHLNQDYGLVSCTCMSWDLCGRVAREGRFRFQDPRSSPTTVSPTGHGNNLKTLRYSWNHVKCIVNQLEMGNSRRRLSSMELTLWGLLFKAS